MASKSFQTVYQNDAVDRVNRAIELLGKLSKRDDLTEAQIQEIQMVLEERGVEVVEQERDGILESLF